MQLNTATPPPKISPEGGCDSFYKSFFSLPKIIKCIKPAILNVIYNVQNRLKSTCTTNHHLQIQKSGLFKIHTGHIFLRKLSARKKWSCISTFWGVRKTGCLWWNCKGSQATGRWLVSTLAWWSNPILASQF